MSDNTIAQSDQPLSLMRHELAAQYRAAGHTGEQAYGMAGFVADDGNASKAGPAGRVSPRGRGLQVCGKPADGRRRSGLSGHVRAHTWLCGPRAWHSLR